MGHQRFDPIQNRKKIRKKKLRNFRESLKLDSVSSSAAAAAAAAAVAAEYLMRDFVIKLTLVCEPRQGE